MKTKETKTKETPCICLQCGHRVAVSVKDETEINDKLCPVCGGRNLVKENSEELFRRLFGIMGGG